MNILRTLARWLCLFVVILSVSLWLPLATLTTTLANRAVVKTWLGQSGVYKNALSAALEVQPSAPEGDAPVVTQAMVAQALNKTYPPDYVQQYTETVLDASYNWIEQKASAIHFVIPVQDQRSVFAANLAAALEPEIVKLPACLSAVVINDSTSCIPKTLTAATMAATIAQQAVESSSFLGQPITEATFGARSPALVAALPPALAAAKLGVWLLPLVAILAGALYVVLHDSRLRGLAYLGRRLTVGCVLTLLVAAAAYYYGHTIQLDEFLKLTDSRQITLFKTIIEPILHTALPGMAVWLAIFSGGLAAISLTVWLVVRTRLKSKQEEMLKVPYQGVGIAQTMPGPTPAPSTPPLTLPPPVKPPVEHPPRREP